MGRMPAQNSINQVQLMAQLSQSLVKENNPQIAGEKVFELLISKLKLTGISLWQISQVDNQAELLLQVGVNLSIEKLDLNQTAWPELQKSGWSKLDTTQLKDLDLSNTNDQFWVLPLAHQHRLNNFLLVRFNSEHQSLFEANQAWLAIWAPQLITAWYKNPRAADQAVETIQPHLLNLLHLGVVELNSNQEIVYLNQWLADNLDLKAEAYQNKHISNWEKIFPDETQASLRRMRANLQLGKKSDPIQAKLAVGDKYKTFEIRLRADETKPGQSYVFVKDISYQTQILASHQRSERQLRRVVELVREGITLSDKQGFFEIYNPEMERLTGFTRAEANQLEDFIGEIHPESEVDAAWQALKQLETQDEVTRETQIRSKQGSDKFIKTTTIKFQEEDQVWYLSSYHDDTYERLARDDLEARKRELERLVSEKTAQLRARVEEVETSAKFLSEDPFPVLRIDSNGVLIYANSASSDVLHHWNLEMGKPVLPEWKQQVEQALTNHSRSMLDIEVDGQIISFVIVPIADQGYVNLYGRDVTEERQIAESKNQFLALVSHQLRTPVTSIRWYAELLNKSGDTNQPEQTAEYLQVIHRMSINLVRLVDELLTIAKMEAGKLAYRPDKSRLGKLIDQIIQELRPQAEEQQMEIKVELDSDPVIQIDTQLIGEVIRNLLSNAIKYGDSQSRIDVSLKHQEEALVCRVTNQGIGIPESASEYIFERFYRAQNAKDVHAEGTGLGLSLVKMIIDRAGGKVWYESEPDKETSFYFTIPLNRGKL